MSDKKNDGTNARRKLLKNIAVGSGAVIAGKSLPDSWSRPVVDSVMLPAHAQTSGTFAGASTGITQLETNSLVASIGQSLIPDAKAQTRARQMDASYCFTVNPERTSVDMVLIITLYTDTFSQIPGTCIENYLINLTDIRVGRGAYDLPEPVESGCNGGMQVLNSLKNKAADSLLAKTGLINDASAGEMFSPPTIDITSATGTVTGVLDFFGLVDNFTIGLGTCETFVPTCSEDCDIIIISPGG